MSAFAFALASLAGGAEAQQATPLGLARAASLMRQISATCAVGFNVDTDLAARSEKTFVQAGEKAFGRKKFDGILAAEYEARQREIATKGSDRWCADQREALQGAGGGDLFRK